MRRVNPERQLAIAALCLLAGCRSFEPATAATKAAVQPMLLAAQLPADQFVFEIDSRHLAGVYDALHVVDEGPDGGCTERLQLFPDVGGKVLDLTVTASAITCHTPEGSYRAAAPFAAAEPHLALVLAAMLAELRSAPTPARIVGQRRASGGGSGRVTEVQLLPALGSGTVVAELAADGRIQCYRIVLGYLEFALRTDGSFQGRGFAGRLCP